MAHRNRALGAKKEHDAAEAAAARSATSDVLALSPEQLEARADAMMAATGLSDDKVVSSRVRGVVRDLCVAAIELAAVRDHLYRTIVAGHAERRETSAMVSAHKQYLATLDRLGLPGDIDLEAGGGL